MATRKKSRTSPIRENPQQYEHRIEMAIEALGHALSGARKIVEFMSAQQSPSWQKYGLVDDAAREFRLAQRRLKHAKLYSRNR